MSTFTYFITGGFAKGYRTKIVAAMLILNALASFATGDFTLAQFFDTLKDHWAEILAAFGLLTAAEHKPTA